MKDETVVVEMLHYIRSRLEQAHPTFGGLPICPFVRQARLNQKLWFFVHPFHLDETLISDSSLSCAIDEFSRQQAYEVMVVVHPDQRAFELAAFHHYLNQINAQLSTANLIAFGGHPQDMFTIEGVRTRQDPYINFTVQSKQKLRQASDQLSNTEYYKNWSAEMIRSIRSD